MEEKILTNKKHGMRTLLICILVELIGIAGIATAAYLDLQTNVQSVLWIALAIVSGVVMCLGWIPLAGLRVLKPQEALALTLFGKYVGTLKGEGFY